MLLYHFHALLYRYTRRILISEAVVLQPALNWKYQRKKVSFLCANQHIKLIRSHVCVRERGGLYRACNSTNTRTNGCSWSSGECCITSNCNISYSPSCQISKYDKNKTQKLHCLLDPVITLLAIYSFSLKKLLILGLFQVN